jgi:glyoxylase-like metal-dependent hydrolase (beta-lactamase superfamily II)
LRHSGAQAPAPAIPPQPASAFVEPGVLPKSWMTGGPKCMEQPSFQVHEYNPNFFILRESGCIHYEKPFLYLIFGRDKVLLEDTGAGTVDTAPVVMDLIARWQKRNNRPTPPQLIVTHSHSHGDHTAGDKGFATCPTCSSCSPRWTSCRRRSASRPGRPTSSRSISATASSI